MTQEPYSIHRLTPAIGAEITGVDFCRPLDDRVYDTVYQWLIDYQVIFFRNQKMTPQGHLDLAQSLGDPEPPHPVYPSLEDHPHVMVLDFAANSPPDTDVWHTDLTFKDSPPTASIIYSRVIPPVGGDTLWASLTAAYDALPAGVKSDIAELRAVHDMGDFRNNFTTGERTGNARPLSLAHERLGNAIHPLVKHHPITGKPILYCNPAFTVHVEGLTASDSRNLLNYLFEHITRPQFQLRFKWTADTVAIWDNRCTMHFALGDYLPARRTVHRVTVINDKRIGC
ncbi:MAG: TauD/TfdA family dioxygenase [Acidiferrobacterales bacterium]|nr:TauD/TfdA family dioxygenase [Acidiferrobacterales bacterium]